MRAKEREQQEAIEELRKLLKPGDKLTTVLRHRSSSGMSRAIDVYLFQNSNGDGVTKFWLSRLVAKACGYTFSDKYDALIAGGCGMDMGFSVVYDLSRTLFHDNFVCIGKGCPSNDHNNGDRNYEPHKHSDGGYALRQEWL